MRKTVNKVQVIIVYLTSKVFNSDNFLHIVSKADMRKVVNRESQMKTIKFQKENYGYVIHSLSDKALKGTIVNWPFLSIE